MSGVSLAVVALTLMPFCVSRASDTLTLGSRAPGISSLTFVRGDAVDEFSSGRIYVIEFSGTRCGPCIASIPTIESLRKAHRDVVFFAVFAEPEGDVREFLKGPGKAMKIPVACDPDGVMVRDWSEAALQTGIPHVFVVNQSGRIAWIGHPERLAEPLSHIVKDGHVSGAEAMGVRIAQHIRERQRRLEQRRLEARERNETLITSLIKADKFPQALDELNAGLKEFSDIPEVVELFRTRKLYVLGQIDGPRDESFALALDMAADLYAGDVEDSAKANSILNHFETAIPANRDERLVELALAALSSINLPSKETARSLGRKAQHFTAVSRAYRLLCESGQAAEALSHAVNAAEAQVQQLTIENAEGWYIKERQGALSSLRDQLAHLQHPGSTTESAPKSPAGHNGSSTPQASGR